MQCGLPLKWQVSFVYFTTNPCSNLGDEDYTDCHYVDQSQPSRDSSVGRASA